MRISDWSSDVCPSDLADLDPAQRAGWTADQWARAEAAGLVAFAPPPARQLGQLGDEDAGAAAPDADAPDTANYPVWWCDYANDWRRSEGSRVGQECVRACSSRWSLNY